MAEEENNIIEISDEEGNVIKCELYDIIEFDDNQYAILTEANSSDEEPEMVLMRYSEEDGDSYFETIDDEEEFNKVVAYLETLDVDDIEDDEE